MSFTPRRLSDTERAEMNQTIKDLRQMLDQPGDEPHLTAAELNVLKRYGQLPNN